MVKEVEDEEKTISPGGHGKDYIRKKAAWFYADLAGATCRGEPKSQTVNGSAFAYYPYRTSIFRQTANPKNQNKRMRNHHKPSTHFTTCTQGTADVSSENRNRERFEGIQHVWKLFTVRDQRDSPGIKL